MQLTGKLKFNYRALLVLFVIAVVGVSVLFHLTKPSHEDDKLISAESLPSTDADTLIVLLHAYTASSEKMNQVKEVMQSLPEFKTAHFLIPDLPFSLFSMESPYRVTHEIVREIDKVWDLHNYKKIILVGHSMGALFARKTYALASGENSEARFEAELHMLARKDNTTYKTPRPWVSSVDRIVLLAGMNNGWSLTHHMGIYRMLKMQLGTAVGHFFEWMHEETPIIFSIRNGSGFITQLRLQWIAMKKQFDKEIKNEGNVLTVQLLGTVDDLVPPTDNVDSVTGKDFYYIEVPFSGHANVVEMALNSPDYKEVLRAQKFIEALKASGAKKIEYAPEEVTDVVFVIHGIRDYGYWTDKIAKRVKVLGAVHNKKVESISSSYGYFPMLGFLRPGARDDKVQWFMNNYAVAKARYPNATFHFVGHSHGTYLLARAIEKYESVVFGNVVFAGSVVRKDFDWEALAKSGRVQNVLNYAATADWVVGWFPNALEMLELQDLGSAGHNGFNQASTMDSIVYNEKFVIGDHSAAIKEYTWDSIAYFVVMGDIKSLPSDYMSKSPDKFVSTISKFAPVVWIVIAFVLIALLILMLRLKIREWKKTLLTIMYVFFVWTVITKV